MRGRQSAIGVMLLGPGLALWWAGCGSDTQDVRSDEPPEAAAPTPDPGVAQAGMLSTPSTPSTPNTPNTPSTPADDTECGENSVAAHGVRVLVAHAEREGIAHAVVSDCHFDAVHCGAEHHGEEESTYGERCVVDARPRDGYVEMRLHTRAVEGAPRWIDAVVAADADASEPPGRFYVGASTWALGRRHAVVVGGVDGRTSHTHGGESAHVGRARLSVRNDTSAPLDVRARSIEWLTSNSCEVPTLVRDTPAIVEPSAAPVVVAPHTSSVIEVQFTPQAAYYSYCDRFAARVTLDVGGESMVIVAETQVSRREVIHRDIP